MIKVCMIMKKERFILANYWEGCSLPLPPPPSFYGLRSNKPKNTYRFTIC